MTTKSPFMKRNEFSGLNQFRVWYTLVGGAIAWFIHLALGSFIAEGACVRDGTVFTLFGMQAAGWFLYGLTAAMFLLCAGAITISFQLRKNGNEDTQFVGMVGIISNLVFLGVIVAQAFPIIFLYRGC